MQIALCHENVLPARGGAEMYVADLARRIVAAGHDAHLYAVRWDAERLPDGLTIHPLPRPRGPRAWRPRRFTAMVRAALDRDRPQISIGFDKTFGTDIYYPLGGLQRASAVHNIRKHRGPWARLSARIAKSLDPVQWSYARLERRHLVSADAPLLVVNSEMVKRHAVEIYGISPQRVRVIHNAIDPKRFEQRDRARMRTESRREWGFGPGDIVAAFVAMNYHLKGLETLLRALQRVPSHRPIKLVVAGHRKTAAWLRMAERLGVERRIAFIGPCHDVRRVYFGAEMLVHPTFYDPCSGVVLEALACGLPVVTTRCNGAAELLRPADSGIVLDDPRDDLALADALHELADPVRRDAASTAALQAASAWTLDDHYARWLRVFDEVAAMRRAA